MAATTWSKAAQAAGKAAGEDYSDNRYHKPGDQYDAATWKLDGIVQDLERAVRRRPGTRRRRPVAELVRRQSVQGRARQDDAGQAGSAAAK